MDLLRGFPRLPFHDDFAAWAALGRELLDLHIGSRSVEHYGLERLDKDAGPGRAALRADKEHGAIVLDGSTTLAGVPAEASEYRLGSRSALEWVLDQYKERQPRDPTIRDMFNTYHFADHNERVIDLPQRVCTVSIEAMAVLDRMAGMRDGDNASNAATGPESR